MKTDFFRVFLNLAITVMLAVTVSGISHADIYKYTDNNGTVSITNDIKSVPKQFRSTMTVEKETPKPQKAPAVWKEEAPAPSQTAQPNAVINAAVKSEEPEPATRFGKLSAKYPWIKPLAAVTGALAAFFLVTWIASRVSSPQLSKIIYFSFFMGVFAFCYTLYARHIVNSYFTVKQRAVAMFMKASVREVPSLPKDLTQEPISK